MPKISTEHRQIEIPVPLYEAIQAEAKRTRQSITRLIAESVARYIEDEDDRKDIAAAKK